MLYDNPQTSILNNDYKSELEKTLGEKIVENLENQWAF